MEEQVNNQPVPEISDTDKAMADFVNETGAFIANILKIIEKQNALGAIVNQIGSIVSSNKNDSQKVSGISAVLVTGGDQYKAEEVQAEQKPYASNVEAITDTTNQIAKSSLNVIPFALAIPLLISNPEIINTIKGFFVGFLEGVGLSNQAIERIKPIIAITIGVLATYWTLSALGNVITAFEKMVELAKLVGIAGQDTGDAAKKVDQKDKDVKKKEKAVKAEGDRISKEKDDIKKGNEKAKEVIKENRDEIKKAKRAGSKSKTKIGKFFDKVKYLTERVTPKLANMGKTIVKSLPIVGSILGIGLVLYELYSIGSDIYDVFFGNDDEEEKPAVAETKPTTPVTAPAVAETKPTTPVTAPAASVTTPAPSVITATTSKPGVTATDTKPPSEIQTRSEKASSKSDTPPPLPSINTDSITIPQASPAVQGGGYELANSVLPSKDIITKSKEVDALERDQASDSGSVLVVVNNNKVVTTVNKQPVQTSSSVYSVTVGA